jgi:type I restriction enzyme S subunit
MSWQKYPLRKIAPPIPSSLRFAPDESVWHLTLDQIESDTGHIINKRFFAASEAGNSTFVFDEGNVLYSKLRPYLNKVVCPKEAGIATTELVPLRPIPEVINAQYLAYYLRSKQFVEFASAAVAGVKMPRIIMDRFWEHEVPVPPLSEQLQIVEILDHASGLRNNRAKADAKAQRILPALFARMFGSVESIKNWTNLDHVVSEFRYGTSNKSEHDGCVTLRIPNIVEGRLNLEDLKRVPVTASELERLTLQQGDLLFVRTNGNPDYVGRSAIFERELVAGRNLDSEKIIFASYLIRARLDPGRVEPLFLQAYLSLPKGRRDLRERCRTSAGQYNINIESLRNIPIPHIDIEQQRSFALKAKAFRELAILQLKSGIRVEDVFKSIMGRAFLGKLTARWHKAHEERLQAEMIQQTNALGAKFNRLNEWAV